MTVTLISQSKRGTARSALGFAIAGDDGDYRFATATLGGNKVILEAEGIPEPRPSATRGWSDRRQSNRIDGLPAYPFRNDTLPPESVVFQPMPAFQKIETPVYQLETGSAGRIASLIIRGKQFLSNEPKRRSSVPGGWVTETSR